MKIIYCIASLASKGGTEKVLLTKAKYLVDRGYEVTIIISDQKGKPFAYEVDHRIKIIDLKLSQVLKSNIKGVSFILNIFKLRKIYQNLFTIINPDFIIVLEKGYEDFVVPYINKNIPKIREYHTSRKANIFFESELDFKNKLKSKLIRFFYENQYKKYDAFVCLTHKDKLSWNHLRNVSVIPNIIDEKSNLNSTLILDRPKKLIAVGSMVQDRKGFHELITIWENIEKDYKNWTLHIFGDGPYRKFYENQIKKLNCNNRIFLEGITNNIQEKYQQSQIFLMTSKGEGLPMVILEAQQNGLPVVVYDCNSGPSDIIQNNFGGYLIPMGNKKVFKEKLKALLDSDEFRKEKSKEAELNAMKFTPTKIIPLWEDLFNTLLK